MAATAITMMTLVSAGDGIVSSQNLYGGTHNQFALQLPRFGVDVRFVDPHDLDAVRAAIDEHTRVLYAETIGNPRIDVLDIAGWAQIADEAGLPLVIDNTFATPYLCRPFEHGAHIVVHSATKFIGGHGTSIGGVIVDSGRYDWGRGLFPGVTEPSPGYRGMRFHETFGNFAFIAKARVETMRDFGPVLSPFNAFLLMQGLETLSLRMTRHVENARALAAFLRAHPRVHAVNYPDDADSPYARGRAALPAARAGRDPRLPDRGRPRRRPALHRGLRALLAPRQRRRRQDARDPSRLDDAPPAGRRRARGERRDRGHDPRLGRARGHRGHRLGRRARARGVGVSGHRNQLAGETSPYLLQHAGNPVDWRPWGEEAFDLARKLDRPVLLSIGYSACHWCHVMERESFEDEATAQLMNDNFVSIKVDREERPDVDGLYMTAVVSQTGQGGWPMTVFLLPDGRPFYGGTYFPPEARGGLPSFRQVLDGIAEAYRERRELVERQAVGAGREPAGGPPRPPVGGLRADARRRSSTRC